MSRARVVFAATLRDDSLGASRWARPVMAVLALVVLPGVLAGVSGPRAGAAGLWFGWALVAVGAWIMTGVRILRQNHPMLARLLPGHVTALRRQMVGGLVVVALTTGWLPGLALMAWGDGGAARNGLSAAFIGSLVPLVATMLFFAMRWPVLNVAWFLVPLLLSAGGPVVLAGFQGYVQGGPFVWWGMALVVNLCCAGGVSLAVLRGGPRHRRIHARVPMTGAALNAQLSAGGVWRQWGVSNEGWIDLLSGRAWVRRRLQVRLARHAGRPDLALGLAPDLQPAGQFGGRVLILLGVVALAWLVSRSGPAGAPLRPALLGGCVGSSLAAGLYPRMVQAMRAGAREQALLCLLPGAPRGARLNRWLAGHLAAGGVTALVLTAGAGAAALRCLAAVGSPWWRVAASSWVLSACALPWLWQDWSRAQPLRTENAQASMGREIAVFGAALAVNVAAGQWRHDLVAVLWGAQGAAATVWAAVAWRRLGRWPAAWPVGHAAHRAARADGAPR